MMRYPSSRHACAARHCYHYSCIGGAAAPLTAPLASVRPLDPGHVFDTYRHSWKARASSSSAEAPINKAITSSHAAAGAAAKNTAAPVHAETPHSPPPDVLAAMAENECKKLLAITQVPSPKLTEAALVSCLRAAYALHAHFKRSEAREKAMASRLVALCAQRTGNTFGVDVKTQDAMGRVSLAAYSIMTHKHVEMTPNSLLRYVKIQSLLGRPETLARIFELYASKPKPVLDDNGLVSYYVPQKANSISRAIEPAVADLALKTAIDAKNLDAALGIIEASYSRPAFKRHKLFKYASAPAMALATLPWGIWGLSSAYAANWQNTMDIQTATSLAMVGISGYVATVGSLGMIAKLSNKDQMKRVTWCPGTPLRYRWMREEERAALDKVACAWGFREAWKHGEETGHEWEGLREYMGYRQMLLDRVEFLIGMS